MPLAHGTRVTAPKGDAKTVPERIIKYNFPKCSRVTRQRALNRLVDSVFGPTAKL